MIAVGLIALASRPEVQFRVSPIVGDHAVLQRLQPIYFQGYAPPGAKVIAQLGNQKVETDTSPDGSWSAKFQPLPAGGPYTFTATSAGKSISIKDLLVGELWLAAGQSNMEWPVAKSLESDEMRKLISPQIRLFRVKQVSSDTPQDEVKGDWSVGTPKNCNRWSGIATSFAVDMQKRLGVPVGIIQSTWGGTRIEAWMSTRSLNRIPVLEPLIREYRSGLEGFEERLENWKAEVSHWDAQNEKKDPGNEGFSRGYAKADFDDRNWNDVSLPGAWELEEGREIDGGIWYRKSFELPTEWQNKALRLRLGFVGTDDQTYVNGLKVGATSNKDRLRSYFVGPGVLRQGKNEIAVRVWNRAGEGGILGPTLDIGPIDQDTTLSLVGQWKFKVETLIEVSDKEFEARPVRPMGPGDRNALAGPYNGMISPLQKLPIRGVLWYQGESNTDRPDLYGVTFKAMIESWRKDWQQPKLPFLYVQLPSFQVKDPALKGRNTWARIRLGQDKGLDLNDTGMVVTTDLSDPTTIHSPKKREVGARLFRLALTKVYGKPVQSNFPSASSFKNVNGEIRIAFQNTYGSLSSTGKGFELLGGDGKWYPAQSRTEGTNIKVFSPAVSSPKGVRYNFDDVPSGDLRNAAGLPAGAFLWQEKN
jgi:sialate O-acetylesterase